MSDWIMKGLGWDNPLRIRSAAELVSWVNEIGFLPFFANDVSGFSAEEHTGSHVWWTGNKATDPWEWREEIAASHAIAYGKFFDGRAGFISVPWLPYFANARRSGWDFDGKWQDGRASAREKAIMEHFMNVESEDEPEFNDAAILSTELKKSAGFGKDGAKNYPGILTGLQMQLYFAVVLVHVGLMIVFLLTLVVAANALLTGRLDSVDWLPMILKQGLSSLPIKSHED